MSTTRQPLTTAQVAERERIRAQAQETAARLAKEHGPMPPALADRIGRLLTEAGTRAAPKRSA